MYRYLARHILAPTLDSFRGTQAMRYLRELEESQWWSRDRILELQNQRLGRLVRHAFDNVPYYRRVFDVRGLRPGDIKGSSDLSKLPILTKRLVRSNFDEIAAQGFPEKERVLLATGGSTGQPLLFYTTRHDHKDLCIATRQRAHSGIGFELGDKSASIRNRYPAKSMAERFWQTPIRFFQRTLPLDIRELPSEIARKLEAFQPKFITGSHPSAVEQVARFIQRKGNLTVRPGAIVTDSEKLHNYQRDLYRQVFGCDTYDVYSSEEEHVIAFECSQHSGYHIPAENVIVEIVDTEGKPMSPGNEGRILITNLYNYAMPFIRYEIGDMGVGSDEACPCGRGLPMLAAISGRDLDMIQTRSRGKKTGMSLYPLFRLFACLDVEQYQIEQETHKEVVIKLVLDGEYLQGHMDVITEKIVEEGKRILGEDMDILTKFVDQIPLTPAGKRRVIISNLTPGNSHGSAI